MAPKKDKTPAGAAPKKSPLDVGTSGKKAATGGAKSKKLDRDLENQRRGGGVAADPSNKEPQGKKNAGRNNAAGDEEEVVVEDTLAGANFADANARLLARVAYSEKHIKPQEAKEFPLVEFVENASKLKANGEFDTSHPAWLREQSTLMLGATRVLDMKQEQQDAHVDMNYENMRANWLMGQDQAGAGGEDGGEPGAGAGGEKKDKGPSKKQRRLEDDIPDEETLLNMEDNIDWATQKYRADKKDITLKPIVEHTTRKDERDLVENARDYDNLMLVAITEGPADFGFLTDSDDEEDGKKEDAAAAAQAAPDDDFMDVDDGMPDVPDEPPGVGGTPMPGGGVPGTDLGGFSVVGDILDPVTGLPVPAATPAAKMGLMTGPGANPNYLLPNANMLVTPAAGGGFHGNGLAQQAGGAAASAGGMIGGGGAAAPAAPGQSEAEANGNGNEPPTGPQLSVQEQLEQARLENAKRRKGRKQVPFDERVSRFFSPHAPNGMLCDGVVRKNLVLTDADLQKNVKRRKKFTYPPADQLLHEFHHLPFGQRGGRSCFSLTFSHEIAEFMVFAQWRALYRHPNVARGLPGVETAETGLLKRGGADSADEDQSLLKRQRRNQGEEEEEFSPMGRAPSSFGGFGGSPMRGGEFGSGPGFSAPGAAVVDKPKTMMSVVEIRGDENEDENNDAENITGYSARTAKMHSFLSHKLEAVRQERSFVGEDALEMNLNKMGESVSFKKVVKGERFEHMQDKRRALAGCFFEMLVLKTMSVIEVDQGKKFGDIKVSHGDKWTEEPEQEEKKRKPKKPMKSEPKSPLQKALAESGKRSKLLPGV